MKYLPSLLLTLLAFSLGACSNEQVYNAVQQNRETECAKLPRAERERCLQQYETSYEEYNRNREELLKQ